MENVDIARRFYGAMHQLDTDGMLAVLARDLEAHVSAGFPGGFGGTHRGRDEMLREVWVPVYQAFGSLPHPEQLYDAGGDTVVAVGEYRGTVPSTGRPIAAAFAHVLRIRDDVIVELRQITDTAAWADGTPTQDTAG